MAHAVALLRAVGGPTALKMAELRSVAESVGMTGVATLQVAGNLLFDHDDEPLDDVAVRLRAAVLKTFGHDLAVIMRTHEQLVEAVSRNPFIGDGEGRWVTTVFLDGNPDPTAVAELDPDRSPGDRFVVDGAEVFIHYGNGVGPSKLSLSWFERGLAVVGTARNANTMDKLVAMSA